MSQSKIKTLEKRLEALYAQLRWQISSVSDQVSDLRSDLSMLKAKDEEK